jgi:inhibitor of KinA sporulation pathway (predicted exonuclease)
MILIIDLENTCLPEHERPANYHGQIIEIGAAWVTLDGEVTDTFEIFVQAQNPVTAFCTELTGITQQDVDTGLPLPAAMQALADFAQKHPGEKVWGSWGNADINSLNRDCAHHGVESPLKGWTHRNLKKEWSTPRRAIIREKYGPKANKQAGMARALEIAGIELEGPHHRALADVLNIAKLLPGCVLPADTVEEVEDPARPETEFQRLVRQKKKASLGISKR